MPESPSSAGRRVGSVIFSRPGLDVTQNEDGVQLSVGSPPNFLSVDLSEGETRMLGAVLVLVSSEDDDGE